MTLTIEQQKANRKLWVEALRSGKYEQGKNNLYRDGQYCCLGVLASCAGYPVEAIDRSGTLTGFDRARDFVGLRGAEGGFFREEGGSDALTSLNDHGTPFAQIADIIESEPLGLFVAPASALLEGDKP